MAIPSIDDQRMSLTRHPADRDQESEQDQSSPLTYRNIFATVSVEHQPKENRP